MSRFTKNRKRPDSVRMPPTPGLSRHPLILNRSASAGPAPMQTTAAAAAASCSTTSTPTNTHTDKANCGRRVICSNPGTPLLKQKQLEKIPSISAKSDSSEDDEDEDDEQELNRLKSHNNNKAFCSRINAAYNANDDDDDDDEDNLTKRSSVIKREFSTTANNWSPCGGKSINIAMPLHGNEASAGSSSTTATATTTRTLTSKVLHNVKGVCKTTGCNLIKKLSSSKLHVAADDAEVNKIISPSSICSSPSAIMATSSGIAALECTKNFKENYQLFRKVKAKKKK